jgi:uncharacterized membrane protein
MYKYLLFFHVLVAITWVGGGITTLFLGALIRRSNDAAKVAEYGSYAEWVGTHVYLPSSLVLFISGAWMVVDGRWGWSTPWVVIGINGWLFSAVLGATYLGPRAKKLKVDMQTGTLTNEALLVRVDRIVGSSGSRHSCSSSSSGP